MLYLLMALLIGVKSERIYETTLWFYSGSENNATIFDLPNAAAILNHRHYRHDWPTVMYVHGWNESPGEKSVETVLSAYLKRGGYNTILLNWESMAAMMYHDAVIDIVGLGARMASVLMDMIKSGLAVETFHLVGHSLGAQISGHIGRNIIARSRHRIILPRITGLDPAGPLFYPPLLSDHLVASDAQMVDIIHTDSGMLGALMPTGSIDFWPNSGIRYQPGCEPSTIPVPLSKEDRCSHSRSWRFWAESVTHSRSDRFLAVRAASWMHFAAGNFDANRLVPMGINSPKGMTGNFYLQTNSHRPYSRGAAGIVYSSELSRWIPNEFRRAERRT